MTEQTARTLEQNRAQSAWQVVSAVVPPIISEDSAKEHSALARGAAVDVLVNGLGPTLAFWKAKNKDHHNWLYGAVSNWVLTQLRVHDQQIDLLEWLISDDANAEQYQLAMAEALNYLTWIKRFAEAMLPKGDSND